MSNRPDSVSFEGQSTAVQPLMAVDDLLPLLTNDGPDPYRKLATSLIQWQVPTQ